VFHPEKLNEPLKLRKPSRIFVCSTSDLFHEGLNCAEVLAPIWGTMSNSLRHTFIVLTKRPKNTKQWFDWNAQMGREAYLPNVWLGVTVENQARAEERIPLLLAHPAAVHFVSVEPMLGPVDLRAVRFPTGVHENVLNTEVSKYAKPIVGKLNGIDWVIAGPETGPGRRPFLDEWIDMEYDAAGLAEQCRREGVAFFDKRPEVSFRKQVREWPKGVGE